VIPPPGRQITPLLHAYAEPVLQFVKGSESAVLEGCIPHLTQCQPKCLIIPSEHAGRPGQRLCLLLIHLYLPCPRPATPYAGATLGSVSRLLPGRLRRYGRSGTINGTFDLFLRLGAQHAPAALLPRGRDNVEVPTGSRRRAWP